ncbi:4'-phosphopantetheinyl transferase superfamily protein [Micromonospora sp. NPDC047812]|uniref:4'-phosphopantetheinyl transferase superfamily protein n=1 Tax=Micromonospora sp. NPDC047812 TaxID=3155742 RepID=UPI003455EE49
MVTARQRAALARRARPRRDPTGRHRGIVRLRLGARVRVAVAEQRLLAHLPPAPTDLATVGDLPAGPRAERLAARALLRRCCAPTVRAALDRLPGPARVREFAWIWTVQEACVKATGAGLGGRPWAIPVPSGRRTGRWADLRWVSLRGHSRVPASVAHGVGTR